MIVHERGKGLEIPLNKKVTELLIDTSPAQLANWKSHFQKYALSLKSAILTDPNWNLLLTTFDLY